MLQQEEPKDFVIATGVQFSVRQFILWAAEELGIAIEFKGTGVNEIGVVAGVNGNEASSVSVGDVIVRVDERYFRPTEVKSLLGDSSKAKLELGWEPEISVREMCSEMVRFDYLEASKGFSRSK